MKNDLLLPGYNLQVVICDEMIAHFGSTEQYYQCEDCEGCVHREKCHKSKENRIVHINEELTKIHSEVLTNLNCVHGALLRMNRSIQAECTLGGIKWNKGYKRLRRRGIEGVILELGLISCGFNLYKFHLKRLTAQKAAQKSTEDPHCWNPPLFESCFFYCPYGDQIPVMAVSTSTSMFWMPRVIARPSSISTSVKLPSLVQTTRLVLP